MSEHSDMFGSTNGKGDKLRPTNLKKFRARFPKNMGKKSKVHPSWETSQYTKSFLLTPKQLKALRKL